MEPDAYKQLIKNRESTYPQNFIPGQNIPDEIIQSILDSSVWAPTHGLTQPWFFKVYHGEGVNTFFKGMVEIYKQITPAEKISEKKIEKYHTKIQQISHVIAVCMRRGDNHKIPEIEEIVATGCVIENIYLGLEPHGIAGYISTGDICYTQEMKTFLKLEKNEACLGFFQLGIKKPDATERVRKRIPAKEKTEWINV